MIYTDITAFRPPNIFVPVRSASRADVEIYLKIEMFNPSGSIKYKPAVGMVLELERAGILRSGSTLIDTTSGNMGIALALIARARNYGFICVTDEKITRHNRELISAYGAELVILESSTLASRIEYIEHRRSRDSSLVWPSQFDNIDNPKSHRNTTAAEIVSEFPSLTHLVVGAGTAGTLTGCFAAFEEWNKDVEIVAVDVPGSAHFSSLSRPGRITKRSLPGIGATRRSPFLDSANVSRAVIVPEFHSVTACRDFLRTSGWLLGASSGSVLAALHYLAPSFAPGSVVVGIAADSGERYLSEVYGADWALAEGESIRSVDLAGDLEMITALRAEQISAIQPTGTAQTPG